MGIASDKSFYKGVTGKVGTVIMRMIHGQTIVQNIPKPRTNWSKAQVDHRDTFAVASRYAKEVTSTSAGREVYRRGIIKSTQRPYQVALRDYMHEPVIHEVITGSYTGKKHSSVEIYASDDFQVASVQVKIINGAGVAIETGHAMPHIGRWIYKATVDNESIDGTRIRILVSDLPLNKAKAEALIVVAVEQKREDRLTIGPSAFKSW